MSTGSGIIYNLISITAWRMDAPEMYGGFHIAAVLIAVILALFGAVRAKRLDYSGRIRLLSVCGWILAVMEVYKQLFLYFIVNQGAYDWWYFPFQLCSVPMYLCILLPLMYRSGRRNEKSPLLQTSLTFLTGFTFIGAAAALIVPEDFMRSYISLTLHGFIWHGMLVFISLTIALSGMADLSFRGFARSAGLFAAMCIIAIAINVLTEPAMQSAHAAGLVPNQYAAMFYLNPYHISPQPVVSTVQKSAGIPLGLALYILVIILAAGAADFLFGRLVTSGSRDN